MSLARQLFYLTLFVNSVYSLRIGTQQSEVYLDEGDEMSLECLIERDTDVRFNFRDYELLWRKKQTFDHDGTDQTVEGDYAEAGLKGIFADHESGRFMTPIFNPNDPPYDGSLTSTIKINDVRPEDQGVYECQLIGPSGVMGTVAHTVFVKQEMESIVIKGYPDASSPPSGGAQPSNGGSLEYVRETNGYFSCEVRGGRPEPDLEILIDDDRKTPFFTFSKNCTIIGDTELLQYEECVVERMNTAYRPDASLSGSTLTCNAVIETDGEEYHRDQASVTLEIVGTPQFPLSGDACAVEQFARAGNSRARIHCAFSSNPAPTAATWTLDSANGIGIPNGGNMAEFSSSDLIEQEDGSWTIELTINDVTVAHFRPYELEVTNDQGSEVVAILLADGGAYDSAGNEGKKDDSGNAKMGGIIAAAVLVPLVVIVLAVVLIIFLVKKRKAQGASSTNGTSSADPKKPYDNANYQESPSSQNPVQPNPAAGNNKPVPAPRRYASNSSLDFDKPYPGQHNSGQADLGMKALSGSVPGLNESMENLGGPPQYRQRPQISQDPGV